MTLSYWLLDHGISSSDDELEVPVSRPTFVLNHNLYWSGIFPLPLSVRSSPEKYSTFYKREIDHQWQSVENSYSYSHYWSSSLGIALKYKNIFFLKTLFSRSPVAFIFNTAFPVFWNWSLSANFCKACCRKCSRISLMSAAGMFKSLEYFTHSS